MMTAKLLIPPQICSAAAILWDFLNQRDYAFVPIFRNVMQWVATSASSLKTFESLLYCDPIARSRRQFDRRNSTRKENKAAPTLWYAVICGILQFRQSSP